MGGLNITMNNSSATKLPYPRQFLDKQIKVLDAITKYKYVLYSGAFGAGKTLLMCNGAIQTCINNPNAFVMFGAQTVPMIRDTVVRTFLNEMDLYQEELDNHNIDLKLEDKWRPSIMEYRFYNGATIIFRSCDKPSKFKSMNFDAVLLDEPVDIPEDIFLMLQGRIRADNVRRPDISPKEFIKMKKDPDIKPKKYSHRYIAMAGNPSGKMNWVYQFFFERAPSNSFKVHTTTKDNKFLPEDYIKSMYETYDFEYARRYLEGEWGSFIGLVYKDFNYDKHVRNFAEDKTKYKYYIAGVDVGYTNPTAMLIIGITNDNKAHILKEYYKTEQTTDVTVQEIAGLDEKYKFRYIYVDPAAADWIEKAKTKRLRVVKADNDIDMGVAKIKSLFKNDLIYVDRSCENFLKELESYQYDKTNVRGNETEKPMKKADHAMDAMRYAFSEWNPWRQRAFIAGGKW